MQDNLSNKSKDEDEFFNNNPKRKSTKFGNIKTHSIGWDQVMRGAMMTADKEAFEKE